MVKKLLASVRYKGVVRALVVSNVVSLILFAVRAASAQNTRYSFLAWNLLLGLLPLLIAVWLKHRLGKLPWLSPANLVLTILWLVFLPNSFYLITDLIHLNNTGEVSKLYDATVFFSFIFNGYISGFISIYILHSELIRRRGTAIGHTVIAGVFVLCGFAIYLGRYLRWNTWDVVADPAGILFDVSERVINPISYPQSFATTFSFFLLLASSYAVTWEVARSLQSESKS